MLTLLLCILGAVLLVALLEVRAEQRERARVRKSWEGER